MIRHALSGARLHAVRAPCELSSILSVRFRNFLCPAQISMVAGLYIVLAFIHALRDSGRDSTVRRASACRRRESEAKLNALADTVDMSRQVHTHTAWRQVQRRVHEWRSAHQRPSAPWWHPRIQTWVVCAQIYDCVSLTTQIMPWKIFPDQHFHFQTLPFLVRAPFPFRGYIYVYAKLADGTPFVETLGSSFNPTPPPHSSDRQYTYSCDARVRALNVAASRRRPAQQRQSHSATPGRPRRCHPSRRRTIFHTAF